MEYLDKMAEDSVKEAIESTVASGKRANGGNVPHEAESVLLKKARGRVSQTDARNKVQQAIERLRARKEIKAPRDKQHDWVLMSRTQRAGAESTAQPSEEPEAPTPPET
ncbi:MAG TPA: hypothetical protein VIC71_08755 [Gammaproteobacteria bacterium]|jgi:hypothetical protein